MRMLTLNTLFIVLAFALVANASAEQNNNKPLEIRTLYAENGKSVKNIAPVIIVKAEVAGQKSSVLWAVSKDNVFYSVNEPRSRADFEKARKLFLNDAITEVSKSKASPNKSSESCSHSTTHNCVGKELYACVHTVCYRCWIEYTWGTNGMVPHTVCDYQTDDISCSPTGEACAK